MRLLQGKSDVKGNCVMHFEIEAGFCKYVVRGISGSGYGVDHICFIDNEYDFFDSRESDNILILINHTTKVFSIYDNRKQKILKIFKYQKYYYEEKGYYILSDNIVYYYDFRTLVNLTEVGLKENETIIFPNYICLHNKYYKRTLNTALSNGLSLKGKLIEVLVPPSDMKTMSEFCDYAGGSSLIAIVRGDGDYVTHKGMSVLRNDKTSDNVRNEFFLTEIDGMKAIESHQFDFPCFYDKLIYSPHYGWLTQIKKNDEEITFTSIEKPFDNIVFPVKFDPQCQKFDCGYPFLKKTSDFNEAMHFTERTKHNLFGVSKISSYGIPKHDLSINYSNDHCIVGFSCFNKSLDNINNISMIMLPDTKKIDMVTIMSPFGNYIVYCTNDIVRFVDLVLETTKPGAEYFMKISYFLDS